MSGSPRISIIVNTLNRGYSLGRTLDSFRQLTYPSFEVVVVNGPSTDESEEVIASYGADVKVRRCPEANLSMSRNIGIAAAAGEIVAFIDDDGVPEPRWLDELVALYDSDEVGGAGGVVHDHTGYTYQCRFNSSDRLGNASLDHDAPLDHWSFPGAARFPYLIGTNASFRRDALIAVGGFDEEIEYYLDETDVCLRMVDAGWVLRQGRGATVHHKFLPSDVRTEARVTLNNFPVVKNKLYFSLVNHGEDISFSRVMSDAADFADFRARDLSTHVHLGNITVAQRAEGLAHIDRAWEVGLDAGRRGRMKLISHELLAAEAEEFRPFPTMRPDGRRLRLCFVTQSLPPADIGGIGRYMADLARGLAARGHEVRIITTGTGHSTVDLEDGVWVHRMLKEQSEPAQGTFPDMPHRIGANAAAVADEVLRLHLEAPLDAVYGAAWDTETVAVFERCAVPVVTALVTTMGITLRTRPEWRDDPEFMAHLGAPLLELERWLFEHSDGIHAISEAIVREVETTSGVALDRRGVVVSPLSTVDRIAVSASAPSAPSPLDPTADSRDDRCHVLFVGRFEKRKGIDLLLDAIPAVLDAHPGTTFELMGRDDLAGERGVPYREEFETRHAGAEWLDRVTFRGHVDDDQLWQAYADCDVFVAPSRFESFGLIFLEAMMYSLPVVALSAGATPELVVHEETGLLVTPDEHGALAAALSALVGDAARRAAFGRAGRAVYEARFTEDAMVSGVESLFHALETCRPGDAGLDVPAGLATVELEDGSNAISLDGFVPVRATLDPCRRSTLIVWIDGVDDESGTGSHDTTGMVELRDGTRCWTLERGALGRYEHVALDGGGDATALELTGTAGTHLAALVHSGVGSADHPAGSAGGRAT